MIAARFVKTLNVQVGMSLRVLVRIEVHEAPNSFAKVVCNLLPDAMLYVSEILPTPDKAVLWTKVEAGWIQATDGGEISLVEIITDPDVIQHAKADQAEKRQRMASAVAAMLIKSYSLPRAKRLARAILKHATTHYPQTALLKITDLSIDNIMIILNGQSGLTKAQVFEYVKAAAARQTNPLDAVITISQTIFDIICSRPSIWVKDDLNVITTEDIRIRNNRFIMSAAEGHMELFRQFIENKQELTCLHSELHYTALHAAADFGQCAIINYIISLGFSLDIKDPKHGQTALHYAAWGGRTEVAKILIDAGANRQLPCNKGILPYQAADKMGHIPCREVLKFLPPTVQHIEFTDVTLNSVSVIWKIPNMNRDHYAKIDQFCLEFQIVDTMDDLRDPDIVYTTLLHWQYKNLTPFRTHRIRIKAQSVSGWSAWSSWVYCKTLAFQPTPPEPVEVLKVTYNAMLLHWFPPIRENGFPTLFYELEIADYKHVVEGKLPTIESEPIIPEVDQTTAAPAVATENLPNAPVRKNRRQSQQTTGKPLTQTGEGEGAAGTKSKESVGVVSKIHRLLKHKDVKHLSRYVTGLEPNRLYQTRIRAYNEVNLQSYFPI